MWKKVLGAEGADGREGGSTASVPTLVFPSHQFSRSINIPIDLRPAPVDRGTLLCACGAADCCRKPVSEWRRRVKGCAGRAGRYARTRSVALGRLLAARRALCIGTNFCGDFTKRTQIDDVACQFQASEVRFCS